jgi:hypothetical protein
MTTSHFSHLVALRNALLPNLTRGEIRLPAALRNALLPRLIFGKLRAKDAEKFSGRVI